MAAPTNELQDVVTYNTRASLAYLENSHVLINKTNKEYQDSYTKNSYNLGDTISWELPARFINTAGLTANFQATEQRVQTMSVTQAMNNSQAYTAQDLILNINAQKDPDGYYRRYGDSAGLEMGSFMEADIGKNFHSGVPILDPKNVNQGQLITNSGPYRFFGDGTTDITSYQQLAQAAAEFRAFGVPNSQICGIVPNTKITPIVNNGLSQFTVDRGNENADSWALSNMSQINWYESNLLPRHISGTTGQLQQTLTLVATNDPTGANITQLTFSGATPNDPDAVKSGDLFRFTAALGFTTPQYLTFIGHQDTTGLNAQFRAISDVASDAAGEVVINIEGAPGFSTVAGGNQNLNTALVPGQQVLGLPNHKVGAIWVMSQFYFAVPPLPDTSPYVGYTATSKESKVSLRHYHGMRFGENFYGYVQDAIWTSILVPDYAMRLIFLDD